MSKNKNDLKRGHNAYGLEELIEKSLHSIIAESHRWKDIIGGEYNRFVLANNAERSSYNPEGSAQDYLNDGLVIQHVGGDAHDKR